MANNTKNWCDRETACLVELYSEFYSSLEKLNKKKPIYKKIADRLREGNFQRSSYQVARKIANLRKQYKDNVAGTTGYEPPNWVHFNAMHKILHETLNTELTETEVGEINGDNQDNELLSCNDSLTNGIPSPVEVKPEIDSSLSQTNSDDEDSDPPSPDLPVKIPPKKKMKISQQMVAICSESLNFMKQQALKREEERNELKSTNSELVKILGRIATSSETMANSIAMLAPAYVLQNERANSSFSEPGSS